MALLHSTLLYLTLDYSTMSLRGSTSLYHGSTLLYMTLYYSTALYLTLHYSTIALLNAT